MKINKMMRIASVLLVAVLLSTCAIFSTFAKYATTATASDTARVAYWGFKTPTSVTFDLFKHGDGNVIASVDNTDLIAPGTSGTATLTLAYEANSTIAAPEVAYDYSVAVTVTGDTTAFDTNPNFVWKYGNTEYNTIAEFKAAVDKTERVAAGSLPTAQSYTIGWEWKFVESPDYDYDMGNKSNLDDITVTLTITAIQVD